MIAPALVVVVAALCAIIASWLMWWATRRSAMWAMAAGALFALAATGGAVLIAWMMTHAAWGR
jgi:drug/metabolite transporter superfamily protein YnfA